MNGSNYVAIAQILAGDLATSTTEAERLKVRGITLSLADYFAREDPRFARDRFYDAAGLVTTTDTVLAAIRQREIGVNESDLIQLSDFRHWVIDTYGKRAWRDHLAETRMQ